MTSTLKNLSEKAKSLAEGDGDGDGQLSEEELAKLWSQMGLGQGGPGLGGGAGGGQLPGGAGMLPDIMPLVTNMMQNLLSKDILYPALTDLSAKVSVQLLQPSFPNMSCTEFHTLFSIRDG